jgi:hypothetical protein
MLPVVLTYTNYLFIRHNTTALRILFTSTVDSEFIDLSGILLASRLIIETDIETRNIGEPIKETDWKIAVCNITPTGSKQHNRFIGELNRNKN